MLTDILFIIFIFPGNPFWRCIINQEESTYDTSSKFPRKIHSMLNSLLGQKLTLFIITYLDIIRSICKWLWMWSTVSIFSFKGTAKSVFSRDSLVNICVLHKPEMWHLGIWEPWKNGFLSHLHTAQRLAVIVRMTLAWKNPSSWL